MDPVVLEVIEILLFLFILLIVMIMLSIIFYEKYHGFNEIIIPIEICTIFQSGRWLAYYNLSQNPVRLQIEFDLEHLTLNGHSIDDFGEYQLIGRFSRTDLTMNLIKINQSQEKINIELIWQKNKQRFEGTWSMNTNDGELILIKN